MADTIPSAQFPAPVANVWKGMAELMNRGLGALPPTAVQYAKGFMGVGAVLPVLEALCPVVESNGFDMAACMSTCTGSDALDLRSHSHGVTSREWASGGCPFSGLSAANPIRSTMCR